MSTRALTDPAAEFAAALSLWTAVNKRSEESGSDLSDEYQGVDQLMRLCMEHAREFELWACANVDFEMFSEIWPYFLEDNFGPAVMHFLEHIYHEDRPETQLHSLRDGWQRYVATKLNLPLRD